LSIGPAHIAAARTAVSLTGALTRAVGAAAGQLVAGAKPTFEQIFAGQSEPVADVEPPSLVEQLVDRIKNLLSGAGVELAASVSFAVSAQGTLVVDAEHPQRDLIETAIAHDDSVEQLVAQWDAQGTQSQRRQPLTLTIAPELNRPVVF